MELNADPSGLSGSELLRHLLRTIRYRLQPVLDHPPYGFGDFAPGSGVRAPTALLSHMSDVLHFAAHPFNPERNGTTPVGSWDEEVVRFRETLVRLDEVLETTPPTNEITLRLIQGPISDTLTHVGQLTMIRRLAGAPIPGQNFFEANLSDISD